MFHENSAQSSFLRYEDYHPGETSHYLGYESKLSGDLKVNTLQHAFARIVKRHDMLRSCLVKNQDEQQLKIYRKDSAQEPIQIIDISDQNNNFTNLKDALAAANQTAFLTQPFDLQNGPLWRAIILKTAPNEWQLGLLFHPLIADQRSVTILLNELETNYNQVLKGQYLELPQQKIVEVNDQIDDVTRMEYLQTKLADLAVTKFQTPKSFSGAMRFHGKHKSFSLDKELVDKLKASAPGGTLEQVVLASLYALLYRYTGETDITMGTTDANRPNNNESINACASWLTMRMLLDENESLTDLVRKTAEERADAHKYQLPIEDIYQSVLSDQARSALRTTAPFDVLLKHNESAPSLALTNVNASTPSQLDLGYNDSALFQINMNQLVDGSCEGFINYNTDLFDDESIERLLGHWQKLLHAMAENAECKIHEIPLLLESEIPLHNEFNNNDAPSFYADLMTPDIFSKIAGETDNTALVFHPTEGDPERMSFRELDIYTNQIANFLHDNCKLKKGDHIAFSMTRSSNLVALALGALKAGLVIVPLETEAGTLLTHKVKHADAKLIVTDQHTHAMFQKNNEEFNLGNTFLLNMDNPFIAHRIKSKAETFRAVKLTADSPAYIIFSSGTSTGIPKASLLTHGGLANLFGALHDENYPPNLKCLCTAKPTFDAFFFDFLATWSHHGTVHLTTDEERYSPEAVERVIRKEGINFAVFLPDLMGLLPPDLPLDYVISMGAAPREGTFDQWLKARPGRKIHNGIGHTETGIDLSTMEYESGADPELVGSPVKNMKMFILHPQHHTLCPIGIPGEIFVAGPGLAKEYVGNPDLTRNKFITMKFDSIKNKFSPCDPRDPDAVRLYASGDYGCHQINSKGKLCVKLIGRNDRRIKLYGVSIDLDGVEALIGTNPQTQAVAVIPKPDMTGLFAYIVRNRGFRSIPAKDARNALRVHLRGTLLDPVAYPKRIIFLTSLPKTANGKIDLKKLPQPPERDLLKPHHNQDLPQILANMWREVLGSDDADEIDANVTFAELGGNSIALAALEIKINRELPLIRRLGVGINSLSKNMTIHSLLEAVRPLMNNPITAALSPPNKIRQTNNYQKNRALLFPNKAQTSAMNFIHSQTQEISDMEKATSKIT